MTSGGRTRRRRLWLGLAVAAGAALLWLGSAHFDAALTALRDAIHGFAALGWPGYVLYVLVLIATCLSTIVPASALVMAAGAVWGLGLASGLSMIGILIGAVAAFLMARGLLRGRLARVLARRPALARFDRDLGRRGWRIVLLWRFSPVAPFALTSFAFGLSSVTFRDYLIGTLASLPALVLYAWTGATAGEAVEIGSTGGALGWASWGLTVVGLGATGAAVWILARLAGEARRAEAARPGE